jgi:CRISPR-associated protein Cas5a/b/c
LNSIIFYSRIRFSWGFSVRLPGVSAAQPALSLPPPTTIIGAFANPILEALGMPKEVGGKPRTLYPVFDCILGASKAASFGLARSTEGSVGIAVMKEITRIIGAPYKTGGEAERIRKAKFGTSEFFTEDLGRMLPVQALGVAYAPAALADIAWVADPHELAKCLKLGDVNELYKTLGSIATWGVSRLGSKEGIVAVLEGYHGDPEAIGIGSIFKTRMYVPVDCVEPKDEAVSEVTLWDLEYNWRRYYVAYIASGSLVYPPDPISYRLVNERCKAFKVPGLDDVVVVGMR